MKVLIIGNGGREHAIAWKVLKDKHVEHVFVAPGNAGTHLEPRCSNVRIDLNETRELVRFAQNNEIDLTIVGPEAPLANGVVDAFKAANLVCFGPTQDGAQLEASKQFCKDFLVKYQIPTANYQCFTDLAAAKAYVAAHALPVVIKADGLAAGKGVIIANTLTEANSALDDMLAENKFGAAGSRVVVEEFLSGVEVSFIVMTDGQHILPMATSQDHKKLLDGDLGPNTGGMGAYSPAPMVNDTLFEQIMRTIIEPTLRGLRSEGIDYCGFLYAGLMISPQGQPKVLEYNCRMGDPETQPIMMRLESSLTDLCIAATQSRLNQVSATWSEQCALGVVLACKGYPAQYPTGDALEWLKNQQESSKDPTLKIFHAGTAIDGETIRTNGGRVLCATALGVTFAEAQRKAYALANEVSWENKIQRSDIGYQVI